MLRSGRLHWLYAGVYSVVPSVLLSEDGALHAAVLAAGDGAFLARGTAAWRWDLIPAPPVKVELGVPYRRRAPEGITLFQPGALRPADATRNGDFASTSVPRTILDLAIRYEQRPLLNVLAEAEFHHNTRPEDVEAVLRRGHPGSSNLRKALKLHVPGYGEMKSGLERRFRTLLIAYEVELPERNQRLGPYTVDCLWRAQRVVVELDGRQHDRPHQANTDRERDLYLRRHGFEVRRYGPAQIDSDAETTIADLLAALSANHQAHQSTANA